MSTAIPAKHCTVRQPGGIDASCAYAGGLALPQHLWNSRRNLDPATMCVNPRGIQLGPGESVAWGCRRSRPVSGLPVPKWPLLGEQEPWWDSLVGQLVMMAMGDGHGLLMEAEGFSAWGRACRELEVPPSHLLQA